MLLPVFDYHESKTLEEACQVMAAYGADAKIIAGGTDLMVNMKHRLETPKQVVSIARIDELKAMEEKAAGVKIGSCVTVAELIESEIINKKLPALGAGARNLGTPLIRNLATIGGNIGSARPAADLPPSLMAYGGRVVLKTAKAKREVPLDTFFIGPGITEIQPEEILCEIQVDFPPPGSGCGYTGLGARKSQDCNIVNIASFIKLDTDGETIQSARIVMGCVGPIPFRAVAAENCLIGEKATEDLFDAAAQAACSEAKPIDDFRGSAEYKRDMVGVLTRRTLMLALKDTRNNR